MMAGTAAELFRLLDREVWIVTASTETSRGGLVATSVMQASIVPDEPRVVVGIARQHATWSLIEASGVFALHLIAPDRIDLAERFGLHSGREIDKFAGLELLDGQCDPPILAASVAWLRCEVESGWDSGDRTFYLAAVTAQMVPKPFPDILTMRQLIASATPSMLANLRSQITADATRDAAAIRRWRERLSKHDKSPHQD
ncbi:MAG: flavin reductase family protein [Planctomycetaceae bacterium]